MNEKQTEQRKINLIFLIILAFIEVLGTILILFVPVTGTGVREFVPTAMITLAVASLIMELIAKLIRRTQKGKNVEPPERPASTRALAVGVRVTYAVLFALAMIYSRFNRTITGTFLLSAGIVFFCSTVTQTIYSRKK